MTAYEAKQALKVNGIYYLPKLNKIFLLDAISLTLRVFFWEHPHKISISKDMVNDFVYIGDL